jgi:murein DD-endopeptidase MepM/ murein hydrolase activator NlpD
MADLRRRNSQTGRFEKKSPAGLSWFKNVAKSLGFTSAELISHLAPSIHEFTTTNVEYGKELVKDIRELRPTGRKIKGVFDASTQIGILRTAIQNAIDDIKSGKIYNMDRINEVDGQDDFGGDFDFDVDFGVEDFNFDEKSSSTDSGKSDVVVPDVKVTVKNVTPPITKNNPMVKAVERQTQAIYETAKMTSDLNVKIAQNEMMMSHAQHGRTLSGLQTINDNIALLVNFHNESMSKYIGASLKYYEESINLLTQTVEELKKSTTAQLVNTSNRPEDPTRDVLLVHGGLNFRGYINMVKANFKKQLSENPFLSPLKSMFEDKMTLKYLAASPLSFISTKIVTTLIPKFLQDSLSNLDKSFSNFFPALFMRINRETLGSDNEFLRMLGEIFGFDVKSKTSVDLSKYNKGPVPFDGLVHKSITEVIPGYLRKILSALTGKEEVAFDFERGVWKSVSSMKKEFDSNREGIILNAFYDSIEELKQMAETFPLESKKDREAFLKGIDKFFINLADKNTLVNPNKKTDRYGIPTDELRNVYDFEGNTEMQRLFRQMVLSMSRTSQMRMFGAQLVDARRRLQDFMIDAEERPYVYNTNTLFNQLGFDTHLDKEKRDVEGNYIVKKGSGILNPADRLGFTSLDYLRDIKRILATGIRVFVAGGGLGRSGKQTADYNPQEKILKSMDTEETSFSIIEDRRNADTVRTFSDNDRRKYIASGQYPLSNFYDLSDKSDDEIRRMIQSRADYLNATKTPEQGNKVLGFLKGMLSPKAQDNITSIREKINDILQKPAELLKGVVDKIDQTLYTLIFGKTGDTEEPSFMSAVMAKMRETFGKFLKWTDEKVISPIHDRLFGKDGIFTKIKDSEFMKNFRKGFNRVADFFFGKQTGPDGKREGGMFSDVANSFADMWSGVKYYFTGRAYTDRAGRRFPDNTEKSVFGEVRSMFKSFRDSVKTYLFGKKGEGKEDSEKGILSGVFETLKQGFHNFSEAIFGPKSVRGMNPNETVQAMIKKIKERAPKTIAGGIVGGGIGLLAGGGLLGAMIGGPFGAAIIGSATAYLSQSDKFKDWVFGKMDKDGERIGGIISKSTQDFLKKNRLAILGGAGLGALKSILGFGLLPSFLLPGGPIGGAMLGIAGALAYRSEAFQNFLFGPKDADGKRSGGILHKAFGSNPQAKKILGNVGAGAISGTALGMVTSHMGLLGAMLVPGGPIGGAILGAAAGIALSSERWKTALFGDWDEKTGKRKGGLLGKFQNWFKLEVMEPLKLQFKEISINIKEWFTERIANPFREALAPIRKEFQNMTERLTKFFKDGWESFKSKIGEVFENHVGKPFGQFMKENVMDPLKRFFSRILGGIGKIFGAILSSPFKALSAIGEGLTERHKKQGLKKFLDDERDEMFSRRARHERFERGEKLGLFSHKDAEGNVIGPGILQRMFRNHFDKETRERAQTSQFGADYLKNPAVSDEEKAAQKEYFKNEREKLKLEREKLKVYRQLGLKYDYDNFTPEGQDISRIYDGLANARRTVKKGRKLSSLDDETFEKLTGFSLSSLFGKDITIASMSPEDRQTMIDIMNSKISGDRLQKFIMAKFGLVNKQQAGQDAIQLGPAQEAGESDTGGTVDDAADKITDAIREESPKGVIEKELIPEVKETNKTLKTIEGLLNAGRKFGKNVAGKFTLGNKLSKFMGTSDDDDVDGSHEDGLDNVPHDNYRANLHKGEAVIPADEAKKLRKGKTMLLADIATNVKIIAQEVKGQLDGVGSNVYKIRKILQQSQGIEDEDLTGSANRDRVGFWGKIRRAFFRPFDAIRNKIMQGIDFVVGKIRAFGDAVLKVGKAIIDIPVKIGKVIWDFTKHVGSVIKETALQLVRVPAIIGKLMLGAMEATVEAVKAVGPAIGKVISGVGSLIQGAAKMVSGALIGFGKGVGSLFEELGRGTGKFIGALANFSVSMATNIGKLLTGTTEAIIKFTTKTVSTAVDVTLGAIKTISEKVIDVGKSILQIAVSPIRFIATAIGKLANLGPKEVVVKGGYLDYIGRIGSEEKPSARDRMEPIRVTIADVEKCMPVYLCGDKVRESFEKIFPVPVQIVKEDVEAGSGVSRRGAATATTAQGEEIPTPNVQNLADSITKTMINIDRENDREKMIAEAKEERKAKLANVTRKTAEYQKNILAQIEEKEFMRNATERQVSLLERIANSSEEHKNSWLDIFGRKGIITAALLMALPFAKKIWDWLRGFFGNGNDGEGNQSGERAMDNALKYGAQKVLKHVPAKASIVAVKGAFNVGKKVVDVVGNSKIGKALTSSVTNFAEKVSNKVASTQMGQVAIRTVDIVKENGQRVMDNLKAFFEKLFDYKVIKEKIGNNGKKIVESIMKELYKFAKNPTFISKMLSGMAKGAAKVSASVSTAGLLEIGFGIWNFATALINKGDAAYLFNVYEKDVTPKMRLVASIMKTILGVSFVFILELLNAVVVELTQGKVNVIKMIAMKIYDAIADDEAYENLKEAQFKFEKDAEEAGYSLSAWNEKQNKTAERKIVDATNTALKNIRNVSNKAVQTIKTGWNNFWGIGGGTDKGNVIVTNNYYTYNYGNAPSGGGVGGPADVQNMDLTTPSALDVSKKLFSGWNITSQYGPRIDPIDKTPGTMHRGIDLVRGFDSPIGAFVGGTVIYADEGRSGTGYNGLGKTVAIRDDYGYTHVYGHLNSIRVTVGRRVQPGEVIGTEGTTGRSTGSHLHYEVRQGNYGTDVDPTKYLISYANKSPLSTLNNLKSAALDTGFNVDSAKELKNQFAELSILDIFSKMTENFSLYAENIFKGQAKEFSLFGENDSDIADWVTETGLNFTPLSVKNISPQWQQAIVDKAVELIIKGEGGKIDAVTKDVSAGSRTPRGMSLGLMQWNGERARSMLQEVHNAIPNAGFAKFINDQSLWTNNWWPDHLIAEYKSIVNRYPYQVEAVQRRILERDVLNTNLKPIFQSGKLTDPRSMVLLADIGNTGPAHITTFLNKYTPPSGNQPEFPHFFNELREKSYWGNHIKTYKNRLDSAYTTLQSWNPNVGGQGGPSETQDTTELANRILGNVSEERLKAIRAKIPTLAGSEFVDSFRSMQTRSIRIEGADGNTELIAEAIKVLKEIAANTGATSKGIDELSEKEPVINIYTSSSDSNKASNEEETRVEVDSQGNRNIFLNAANTMYNANPILGAMDQLRDGRTRSEYIKAKSIAAGGRYK